MMNNRGAVLPITLSFVLAFTMLGFSTIYLATLQNEAADKRIASEKAFWLAEAGIQKAYWEVEHNDCRGLFLKGSTNACSSCVCGGEKVFVSVDDKLESQEAAKNELKGDYDIELTSASSVVTATGSYPSRAPAPNRNQRTVRLASKSLFEYAIFAEDKISIHNSTIIDSYNSRFGPYDKKKNKAANGDIGSNKGKPKSLGDESILLMSSSIFINGDVSTGPEGKINTSHGEVEDYISGSITYENKVDLPPVVVPSSLKGLASQGDVTIKGSKTITSGNYKYNSILINANDQLFIDGNVRIYLTKKNLDALKLHGGAQVIINKDSSLEIYTDGNVSIEGGSSFNTTNPDPKTLTIYSTVVDHSGTVPGVDIWNSVFHGAIYAPGAHININTNSDVYGSFVGWNFSFHGGGSNLHYDESLAGKITDSTTVWEEISNSLVP